MGRTAPLTSKRCILHIYSTNIGTEYFKPALYSPFFFSSKCSLFHNADLFGSCIIHILYTECAEIKKNNSGAKGSMRPSIFSLIIILLKCILQKSKKRCELLGFRSCAVDFSVLLDCGVASLRDWSTVSNRPEELKTQIWSGAWDWIYMAQYRDWWWVLMNMIMEVYMIGWTCSTNGEVEVCIQGTGGET